MKSQENIPTSKVARASQFVKATVKVGGNYVKHYGKKLIDPSITKDELHEANAKDVYQALSNLKGSALKMAQMMSMDKNLLPRAYTDKFAMSQYSAPPLSAPLVMKTFKSYFGQSPTQLFDTFEWEAKNAASIGQVHLATKNGKKLAVKIQYPGVAEAIDSDMSLFKNMLKLTRMVPQTREFDQWFDEVREMMHREVNYKIEAATTRRFAARLKEDPRYIVPQIIDGYCTDQVLCMTFERGVPINSPVMLSLPQERRNKLGEASLEIAVREIFEWGEMQTDPNFGNYLVRLGNGNDILDKIVLLDFGAIRQFDEHLLSVARKLIHAGFNHSSEEMVQAMTGYEFFDSIPQSIKPDMAKVFLLATEAFSSPSNNPDLPAGVMDEHFAYDWKASQLHSRVMQQASKSMASRYFSVPPKEFMFISRKFIGAYTFMTVIEAKTNVRAMVKKFI